MKSPEHRESKGHLFVFEGIDGAGKTTTAKKLYEHLTNLGFKVEMLREPTTESPWGKEIRKRSPNGMLSPQEELELFLRDRKWHIQNKIFPALANGKIVLLDRYFFASGAYQSTSTGIHWSEILRMNREEIGAPEPEIVFLLDVPVEVGLQRLQERNGEVNLQFEFRERLKAVRQAYLEMLTRDSGNFVLIDATRPLDDVVSEILSYILQTIDSNRTNMRAKN